MVPLNKGNQPLHYYFAILISFSVHQFINLAIRTSLTNIRLVKTELRFLFLSRILVNLQETTIIWSLLKSLLQLLQKSHLLMVRIPILMWIWYEFLQAYIMHWCTRLSVYHKFKLSQISQVITMQSTKKKKTLSFHFY